MQKSEQPKVLILSCGTGEGHNSAAKAIAAGLAVKNIQCEIKDVLSFKSDKTQRRITGLYGTVIKRAPWLFGTAVALGSVYERMRLPSPVYSYNAKYADKLYDYIKENGFKSVVCTQVFAMEAMTAVLRKYRLTVSCYGVITDYAVHPFIKDADLDGYFVGNSTVADICAENGFAKEKVYTTGIPVHPKYNEQISKSEARGRLNLPLDKKVVLIMTGGAGCGKIVQLCKKLNKNFDDGHMFIVLTGRNDKLKEKLDKTFKGNNKFGAVAFSPEVHVYLKAADCVLSKPGGLSSTEIAVANVPLVHLKAIPGVENINRDYFSENGLSLRADTPAKAVKAVRQVLSDGDCAEAMLKIQRFYINSAATEEITQKITEGIANERIFMGAVYSGRVSCGECDVQQNSSQTVDA